MSDTQPIRIPKHPPGRGSQVLPDERQAIQLAHLVEGQNQTQLALQFGRNRETIANIVRAEDTTALKKALHEEQIEQAREMLCRYAVPAAEAWGKTLEVASRKGDHRPAKDLLLHTKVVEPPKAEQGNGPRVLVQIGSAGDPDVQKAFLEGVILNDPDE